MGKVFFMTKKQAIKHKMFEKVLALMDMHKSLTQEIPAFEQTLEKFRNLVSAISIKTNHFHNRSTSRIKAHAYHRELLIKTLFIVMKGLKLHAKIIEDKRLYAICCAPISCLEKLNDTELMLKAYLIADKADAFTIALMEFGITKEKLIKFDEYIEAFRNSVEDMNGGEAGKIADASRLINIFQQADVALEELDDYAIILNDMDKEFGMKYKSVRVINDQHYHNSKKQNKLDWIASDIIFDKQHV